MSLSFKMQFRLNIRLSSLNKRRNYCSKVHNISDLLRPSCLPADYPSTSQKLMLSQGLISSSSCIGMFHYLPFMVKALDKLIKIIDNEMFKIDAQKIAMPTLSSEKLWQKTGRWENMGQELFTVKDRNQQQYCLSPTHEEAVTHLVASFNKLSYQDLPLKLYQITTKYRDEPKPRNALLRGREFMMKDMYSFDPDEESAKNTYERVSQAYLDIFKQLNLDVVIAKGSTGAMGGSTSQEFHIQSKIGEDVVEICTECKFAANQELKLTQENLCSKCGSKTHKMKSIEVGHLFLLGDTYSKPFDANYIEKSGNNRNYYMGCYGLGVTRTIAAAIEVLSSPSNIRWPSKIAPYLLAIIPPKRGSHEEEASSIARQLADYLSTALNENVAYDDRLDMTIGKRVRDLTAAGFPYLIVAGKKAVESVPKFEVVDVYSGKTTFLSHSETVQFVREKLQ